MLLDPKFAKVAALMRSTEHEGERAAAKAKATALAAAAGMTLDQALAAPQDQVAAALNIFTGFDDWMEERKPGHKARCAADRIARDAARRERVAALVARYGSKEAALAPCERERLLRAALKPWIKWCRPPHQRWTYSVDGQGGWDMSPPVRAAVAGAYPLPTTFAEAKAEADYWRARNVEMEDLQDGDCGDYGLDRPAVMRMWMVEELADYKLPVTTLTDLHARFAMYQAMDVEREEIVNALFRDLTAIMDAEHQVANTPAAASPTSSSSVHDSGQVATLISEHMDWTDRRIARKAGCSPTTVGKIRRAMGATCTKRSVHRGGQTYEMKVGRQSESPA